VLGANEAFLSAVRTATGGSEITTPLDPWIHDLDQTSRSTDLWPLLLVLALLLWPIDIALRRVSVGRREFAAAGAWVRGLPRRRGRAAPRTTTGESLLAARERAASGGTRAAMRASEGTTAGPSTAAAAPTATTAAPVPAPVAAPAPDPVSAPPPAAPPPTAPSTAPPTTADSSDTMARLRDAKRRARER
jgi:hypothetical protein